MVYGTWYKWSYLYPSTHNNERVITSHVDKGKLPYCGPAHEFKNINQCVDLINEHEQYNLKIAKEEAKKITKFSGVIPIPLPEI